MSKNKTAKFAELNELPNVYQYTYGSLKSGEVFPHKGRWHMDVFRSTNPIVLELGCGRGEYTVGLGEKYPEKNFVGIDIKGNRMWAGAKEAHAKHLENVAFLRTEIELLDLFFETGEVDEIWITFPDPQMKKVRKRLTSIGFLRLYHRVMKDGGLVHLKTDSPFLYAYTKAVITHNDLPLLRDVSDVHGGDGEDGPLREIRTYYENQWIARGLTIKYLAFRIDSSIEQAEEPDVEIEFDSYRSYGRDYSSRISAELKMKKNIHTL